MSLLGALHFYDGVGAHFISLQGDSVGGKDGGFVLTPGKAKAVDASNFMSSEGKKKTYFTLLLAVRAALLFTRRASTRL